MINYGDMLELDSVTLEDCLDLYEKKGMHTIINDGMVINFVKDDVE